VSGEGQRIVILGAAWAVAEATARIRVVLADREAALLETIAAGLTTRRAIVETLGGLDITERRYVW